METFDHDIAIIGMTGRFPGANSVDELWEHLRDGVETISFFSDEELRSARTDPALLHHPAFVRRRGILDDITSFDASFFGYSPREAEMMDPQQRLFLECAWEALESSGYNAEKYPGRVGVYAGASTSSYFLFHLLNNSQNVVDHPEFMLGNDKDFLTTRVSYKLNLKGPSLNVSTACSTSLVAVHLACQSLLNGECDIALAGGVSLAVPPKSGYLYEEGGILSPDGHCRAFDIGARGTADGDGVGIVVLKSLADALEDGDIIHAVIKGSAINNDGSMKVGFMAPGVTGQAEVIAEALALAEVSPETIGYIEAHGTGTPLGDPIEVAALTQAFRATTGKTGFCALGSIKTNFGHLGAAAGVAGLIKAVLALKHRQIPPSLHFEHPNPQIDFAHSPFYVNTSLSAWETNAIPRRAGVSSFGIGGTNAHVILEEAPEQRFSGAGRPEQLLVFSARTHGALETMSNNLARHLTQHLELNLADVAYTLQVGRKTFAHRRALVCADQAEAVRFLQQNESRQVFTAFRQEEADRPVVFMFPGQGTQYVQMGADLYRTELVFRQALNRCATLLLPRLNCDIRELLYPPHGQDETATQYLVQTELTQPVLFAVEYALAQLWLAWGVKPQAMIGHSIGEYVAACLAGVFSLEDALALVAIRGHLMSDIPTGSMLSVKLPVQQVQPLLGDRLSLAAVNGPELCVVAGPASAVADLQALLTTQGVSSTKLHTSHAFHSTMVEPVMEAFHKEVRKIRSGPPTLPYISNVTGTWITAEDVADPGYWVRHLRQPVQFAAGARELLENPERIFLEVGAGRTLSTFVKQLAQELEESELIVLASLRHTHDHTNDRAFLLGTLSKLWLAGGQINWAGLYKDERRQRVLLPTYPFERERYWLELPQQEKSRDSQQAERPSEADIATADDRVEQALALHTRSELLGQYVAPSNEIEESIATIWQELLGIERIGIYDDFFELGGHSLLATRLVSRLHETFPVEIPLSSLFEATTVAKLAETVETLLIAKLNALSEEEIEQFS